MNRHSESGFTLIEILMALTIFAIGVLAVVNMQMMSTWTNTRAQGMTDGIIVAQNKIEELSALNWANVDLADTQGDDVNDLLNSRTQATAEHSDLTDPVYQVFWNVRDNFPFDDTKFVRVFVVWTDTSINKWFYLDTMITRD